MITITPNLDQVNRAIKLYEFGILDNSISTISIYPNPVKNRIYIKTDQLINSYKIYNVMGQMVLSNIFSGNIDISMLEKGTYFLNLDNLKSKAFIKSF